MVETLIKHEPQEADVDKEDCSEESKSSTAAVDNSHASEACAGTQPQSLVMQESPLLADRRAILTEQSALQELHRSLCSSAPFTDHRQGRPGQLLPGESVVYTALQVVPIVTVMADFFYQLGVEQPFGVVTRANKLSNNIFFWPYLFNLFMMVVVVVGRNVLLNNTL